jgi:hypothetical protein
VRPSTSRPGDTSAKEGRLEIIHLVGDTIVARCRGDSAEVYRLGFGRGLWWCDCPAKGRCCHLAALMLVTLHPGTVPEVSRLERRRGDPFSLRALEAVPGNPTSAVGPSCWGPTPNLVLLPVGVGSWSARVSRIEHMRVETQPDVLPVRLRHAAGAIRRNVKVEA